ncbi:hypothetical protein BJX65DRAFT_150512 [Aspergillus insuetus]
MAANHPIHIHPARPFYRFTATALGASMWFFVCRPIPCSLNLLIDDDLFVVDVPSEEGRACVTGLEASMGSLSRCLLTCEATIPQ